jgi:hypothetical protein
MSELREKVAAAISDVEYPRLVPKREHYAMADAAIALVRAETLEEAAQFIEEHSPRYDDANRPFLIKRPLFDSIGRPYAAAIRALAALGEERT